MIARVSKALSKKDGDKGFTLVELLVVVIIIGILAAVAIPLYLNQQNKAKDASAKSDLANLRVAVASALSENPSAGVSWDEVDATAAGKEAVFTAGTETYTAAVSKGNVLAAGSIAANAEAFELKVTSATGATFTTNATGNVTETAAP